MGVPYGFPDPTKLVITKRGRWMTDKDIEALADEAERGYDVSQLRRRPNRRRR